ncbi:hypothetical protein [Mesobacillus stamsii]|uniref:Uncharacterized protein n=1 Tax=Mesobacillus stamsii TaxID=225347 RepID=A0ABU0FYH7_9BACI|nr:hypothetical protein [Mesobacillus stamsii]MDQ0414996.1 hypothetical protein [Mesobacillus stamsii]
MNRTQLYFWKPLMERHKKELSMVEQYYIRTKPTFNDIEAEATDYANHIYNNYPADESTDLSAVADYANDEAIQLYDLLETLKKNHLLMTISMLCQIWEQQLIKFTLTEIGHFIKFHNNSLSFSESKNIFELHEVKVEECASWKMIKEMRLLVNTIKHGDGESARKLRRIRPDYFELDLIKGTDTLELARAVLLDSYSLMVDEQDFINYVEATKTFWNEMPEYAYSDVNLIITILNKRKERSSR